MKRDVARIEALKECEESFAFLLSCYREALKCHNRRSDGASDEASKAIQKLRRVRRAFAKHI